MVRLIPSTVYDQHVWYVGTYAKKFLHVLIRNWSNLNNHFLNCVCIAM